MNLFRAFFVTMVFSFCVLAHAGDKDLEVSCADTFYTCLTGSELNALAGKTLRYKHLRATEFGVVSITLNSNKSITASNAKSSSGGRWEISEDKIKLWMSQWGDYEFRFVKISDRLFLIPSSGTGGVGLSPVEIQ